MAHPKLPLCNNFIELVWSKLEKCDDNEDEDEVDDFDGDDHWDVDADEMTVEKIGRRMKMVMRMTMRLRMMRIK